MDGKYVTASEVQRNFGQYKELAQREPVMITSNGRESIVMLSAQAYAEYLAFKEQQTHYVHQGAVDDAFQASLEQRLSQHSETLDKLAK